MFGCSTKPYCHMTLMYINMERSSSTIYKLLSLSLTILWLCHDIVLWTQWPLLTLLVSFLEGYDGCLYHYSSDTFGSVEVSVCPFSELVSDSFLSSYSSYLSYLSVTLSISFMTWSIRSTVSGPFFNSKTALSTSSIRCCSDLLLSADIIGQSYNYTWIIQNKKKETFLNLDVR